MNLSDHLDRTVEHAGGEWKSSAALPSPSLSLLLSPLSNFHTGFSCHVMKTVKSVETVEAAEIVNCFIWHRRQLLS